MPSSNPETLVIRGGVLVDGTGAPGRPADVVVRDDRILAVRAPGEGAGETVIDASGLVVAPGFVDMHAHSDLAVLAHPGATEKLRQGVTTEVVGNCGISVVPVSTGRVEESRDYAVPVLGFPAVEWTWNDLDGYLTRVEEARPAVNIASYAGLGSIRVAVSGFRAGAATAVERAEMRRLAAEALRQGAVGLSSGLVYAPGSYADSDEIADVVGEAARAGALYSTHLRDQGDGFLESVEETLSIGRRTGVAINIAHHKVVGAANWGATAESLRRLRAARAEGLDAGSDVYPYLAGSTTMTALLPAWALEGGRPELLRRLADPAARARIFAEWRGASTGWDNRVASIGWDNILISDVARPSDAAHVGRSVAAAAAVVSREPDDFLLDLVLANDGVVGNIQLACDEADLERVLRDPSTAVASDGLFNGGLPHPRLYGTFPRVLGHYVRERDVLSLEEAVRRMSSLPARRLGLPGVGSIRPGFRADLVLFDPTTVDAPVDYAAPARDPVGIHMVLVGGRTAVVDGRVTGERAGIPLRRPALRHPIRFKGDLAS